MGSHNHAAKLVAAVLIGGMLGCDNVSPSPSPPPGVVSGPAVTLRVLASDDLTDMQPILDDAARATGVSVVLTRTTTRQGTRVVVDGGADRVYDAIWLSTNHYLAITPDGLAKVDASERIMSSPVVFGLQASIAHRLGWDTKRVGWTDIAAATAPPAKFTFGMSDPETSNSGVAALVGIATAIAGDGAALQRSGVAAAAPALRDFFGAQSLKTASSGTLPDAYVRGQAGGAQGGSVNGLVEYESLLLKLNASGKLSEPLTLIYPSDGVASADYPLSLLRSAPVGAKDAFRRLVSYLRSADVQREIMRTTRRRPISAEVRPDSGFGDHRLFELPFPGHPDVVNDLVAAYYGRLRRPARTLYTLDLSGSMRGERLAALKKALHQLTGAGADPGQVTRFQEREQVIFIPFRSAPVSPATFNVPPGQPDPILAQIRVYVDGLAAEGNTAIYDALVKAYETVAVQAATDPDRITTIVLLTDGENNTGRDLAAFIDHYHSLPTAVASVPIFPILFGESDPVQMRRLAELTGGQTFDGRGQSLAELFPRIRAGQ